MKHLKKMTAVLLAALLAFAPSVQILFPSALAAEQSVSAVTSAKSDEICAGEEVTLGLTLSEAVQVNALVLDFATAYDHDVFEWVEGAWSDALELSAMTDVNAEKEVAAILNQTPVLAEGEIFTFTLRVKDGIPCETLASVEVAVSGVEGLETEAASLLIDHKYSNVCDTACDLCGEVRVPDEHDYTNACDTECNLCGAERVAPHAYDNDGDETCNLCGESRVVEYALITTLSHNTLSAGEPFTVTVTLSKARQTKSFALDLLTSYDHDAFEWVEGDWSDGVKTSGVLADVKAGSEAVFLAANGTEVPAGEIFRFVLRVKEGASCLKPYGICVSAVGIPNLTVTGANVALTHTYSSDCDPRCDACEMPRTALADHSFKDDCDTECDLCGAVRTVAHDYEFECSSVCSLCGAVRVTTHTYTDSWDDFCDVCGESREIARTLNTTLEKESVAVGDTVTVKIFLQGQMTTNALGLDFEKAYDHDVFEWVDGTFSGAISMGAYTRINEGVDAMFLAAEEMTVEGHLFTLVLRVKDTAVCGEEYEICVDGSALRGAVPVGDVLKIAHGYTNACDADCNACGEVREVAGHVYDHTCDAECNVCGELRQTSHSYDNDGDEDCNACGETRLVERELITSFSVEKAAYGDEICVTVSLSKSKRTQSLALDLATAYDHGVFEWVEGFWSDAVLSGSALASVDDGEAAVFLATDALELSGEIFTFTLRLKKGDFCGNTYEIKALCTQMEGLTLVGDSLTVEHAFGGDCDGVCEGCGLTREPTADHSYDHDGDEACNVCGALRLALYGTSLSLQHNFAINYKVKASLAEKYTDFYVVAEMNGKTVEIRDYTEDGAYLSFRFENIAPQKIGDSVTATLYAKENGSDVATEPYVFGVKDYCDRALELYADDAYASFRTLIVDLLRYGAKAQLYTGYKTSSLADRELTAHQLAWGTQGDPVLTNHFVYELETVENPTVTWMGAGLVLDSAVTLKLKFAAESVEGLQVRIAIEKGDTVLIDSSYFTYDAAEQLYVLHVNGLNADQMSRKLVLTVLDADGKAVSNTAQYSIESYAYEKQNSTIPGLADLVKAMMHYGNAAKNYGGR